LLGQGKYFGVDYEFEDYIKFIFYFSLCVKMAVIATGSIAERTDISTYVFFSLINSGFIFPVGLAWCWNDGWLQNIGFIDVGGAGIVHVMGGIAGFFGTLLIGPRIGLYSREKRLDYILDEGMNLEEQNRVELVPAKEEEHAEKGSPLQDLIDEDMSVKE